MVNGKPELKNTKTDESSRTVPIDGDTLLALQDWKASQDAEREAWGEAWNDLGYMFTREDGRPVNPDDFTRRTKTACRTAGVPVITPHHLRYLVGTMLMEASVPTRVVSDLLGHSSTTSRRRSIRRSENQRRPKQ